MLRVAALIGGVAGLLSLGLPAHSGTTGEPLEATSRCEDPTFDTFIVRDPEFAESNYLPPPADVTNVELSVVGDDLVTTVEFAAVVPALVWPAVGSVPAVSSTDWFIASVAIGAAENPHDLSRRVGTSFELFGSQTAEVKWFTAMDIPPTVVSLSEAGAVVTPTSVEWRTPLAALEHVDGPWLWWASAYTSATVFGDFSGPPILVSSYDGCGRSDLEGGTDVVMFPFDVGSDGTANEPVAEPEAPWASNPWFEDDEWLTDALADEPRWDGCPAIAVGVDAGPQVVRGSFTGSTAEVMTWDYGSFYLTAMATTEAENMLSLAPEGADSFETTSFADGSSLTRFTLPDGDESWLARPAGFDCGWMFTGDGEMIPFIVGGVRFPPPDDDA